MLRAAQIDELENELSENKAKVGILTHELNSRTDDLDRTRRMLADSQKIVVELTERLKDGNVSTDEGGGY